MIKKLIVVLLLLVPVRAEAGMYGDWVLELAKGVLWTVGEGMEMIRWECDTGIVVFTPGLNKKFDNKNPKITFGSTSWKLKVGKNGEAAGILENEKGLRRLFLNYPGRQVTMKFYLKGGGPAGENVSFPVAGFSTAWRKCKGV